MAINRHINDLEKNKFTLGDDDKLYMQTTDGTTTAQAEIINDTPVEDSHINDLEKRKFAVIDGKTYVRTLPLETPGTGPAPEGGSFTKVVTGPADLNVGDLCYLVGINEVAKALNNDTPEPIIGLIQARNDEVSQFSYFMLLTGVYNQTVPRGELWLSDIGALSTVRPIVGTQQRLGYSFGDGQVYFQPDIQRNFVRT